MKTKFSLSNPAPRQIPKSVPKKFHRFILAMDRQDGFDEAIHKNGVAWDCFTVGISDNNGCHTIIEHKLSDVIYNLGQMKPCDCEECEVNKAEMEKILEATEPKYKILVTHTKRPDRIVEGTLSYLKDYFGYTLEWFPGKDPKTIKALVSLIQRGYEKTEAACYNRTFVEIYKGDK